VSAPALRDAIAQAKRTLRDQDCSYLGNYKLGYDSALDDFEGAVLVLVESHYAWLWRDGECIGEDCWPNHEAQR
jgi:hypothetical protein